MTNFTNLKPYIFLKKVLPDKPQIDKQTALEKAIKIIRENKSIVESEPKKLP